MVKRVRDYIREHKLIKPDEHILVGVSGGADSVCLFFLLNKLSKELAFEYSVIHVNHQIRQTAERDELFVKDLCKKNQVLFHATHVDVPQIAKEQKLSIEEAARIARYEAFYQRANELMNVTGKKVKLAVAHNENDQAETVLFHLFRGCALSGLRGMKPIRFDEKEGVKIPIIRPILCVSRKEIENYLFLNGYTHIEDETNASNEYSRNFIRNELLIQAEKSVCTGAAAHIADTAEKMLELEDYLLVTIENLYETLIKRKGEKDSLVLSFSALELQKQHRYIQKSLIYKAIEEIAGRKKDIEGKHVESVLNLLFMQVGRQVHLPYQMVGKREYEEISLFMKEPASNKEDIKKTVRIPLSIPGETNLPDGFVLKASVFAYEKTMQVPKNEYTKWFDYDKIIKCLIVRNRESTDYFYMDKEHTKQVKRYMIDEKIDKSKRDELLLICEGKHMLWMPGFRISEFYKVEENTKNILELSILGGTKDV